MNSTKEMRPDMFGWLTVNGEGGEAFVFLLEQKV